MSSYIQVELVTNKHSLKQFIDLPWKIYKGDVHWVPPLKRDIKETLNTRKNPFWKHATRKLYIAWKDGEVVGRIAAIIDENYNRFHNEKMGFFGYFESIQDYEVASSLFDAANKWLRIKGMKRVRGPMNPSTNDECAFLLEGFDSDPVVMMPYNPPYYLEFAERYGFYKAKDLYAYLKDTIDVPERIIKFVERAKKRQNIVVRPINFKKFKEEVEKIKDIYNASWEKNWGFVPMTDEEMDYMAKKLKMIADPDLALIAEVNGNPIGIAVTIPDINPILKKLNGKLGPLQIVRFLHDRKKLVGTRSILFGLKPGYRRTGINTLLFYESEIAGERLGYKWVEMSWNLEDNDLINRFDESVGGKLYKKYRIYEKKLN